MTENNIAVYIRLSQTDKNKKDTEESNSITAQRLYINAYLDRQEDLKYYKRIEYIDDGYSGTNDNRPEFKRMIKDVNKGYIKTICLKDMSRFFRDYTIIGNYIECIFPIIGVRFISINDNYDSDNNNGQGCDFEAVIRNIVYSAYSKDLSYKVKKAREHLVNQGKYIGNIPPYGYIKHPENKHKIIIDPIASKVVQKIFNYALDGFGTGEIAKKLNNDGVISKGKHFANIYKYDRFINEKRNIVWTADSVRNILKNEFYIGTMVCFRTGKVNVYAKRTAIEPTKIENNHEPIIDIKDFNNSQLVIKKWSKSEEKESPLCGLVFCGKCKDKLGKVRENFVCINSINNDCLEVKNRRLKIKITLLEEKVIDELKGYIKKIKNSEQHRTINNKKAIKDNSKISRLEKEMNLIMRNKAKLYEEYVEDVFSKDTYLEKRKDLEDRLIEIKKLIEDRKNSIKYTVAEKDIYILAHTYSDFKNLNMDLVKGFIDKIYIYDNEEIEVIMKYNLL